MQLSGKGLFRSDAPEIPNRCHCVYKRMRLFHSRQCWTMSELVKLRITQCEQILSGFPLEADIDGFLHVRDGQQNGEALQASKKVEPSPPTGQDEKTFQLGPCCRSRLGILIRQSAPTVG